MAKPLDQRELHTRREEAIWNTQLAGLAAFGSATLAVIVFTVIGFDTGHWIEVAPYFLAAALTLCFGASVYYRQSQLAAGVLLVLAAATMIARIVQTGQFGGIVIGGGLIYCYYRGLSGAIDLADLAKGEQTGIDERAT
jgi:hypothetical protein